MSIESIIDSSTDQKIADIARTLRELILTNVADIDEIVYGAGQSKMLMYTRQDAFDVLFVIQLYDDQCKLSFHQAKDIPFEGLNPSGFGEIKHLQFSRPADIRSDLISAVLSNF